MLVSLNALARLSLSQSDEEKKCFFEDRDINVPGKYEQINERKRSLKDIGTDIDQLPKIKRFVCGGASTKSKLVERSNMLGQQVERRQLLLMNNDIKEARDYSRRLDVNLIKAKEQSIFWRGKTEDLQEELLSSKSWVVKLSNTVVELELDIDLLQKKLVAKERSARLTQETLRDLTTENKKLKETINEMFAELEKFTGDDARSDMQEYVNKCIDPKENVGDKISGLSDRLAEIKDMKYLLTSILERETSAYSSPLFDRIESEALDKSVHSKLSEEMGKHMRRIALQTQRNELEKRNDDYPFRVVNSRRRT